MGQWVGWEMPAGEIRERLKVGEDGESQERVRMIFLQKLKREKNGVSFSLSSSSPLRNEI